MRNRVVFNYKDECVFDLDEYENKNTGDKYENIVEDCDSMNTLKFKFEEYSFKANNSSPSLKTNSKEKYSPKSLSSALTKINRRIAIIISYDMCVHLIKKVLLILLNFTHNNEDC
jgi:hypothetical protein